MKKSSTVAAAGNKNFKQKLTVGLDLGDRFPPSQLRWTLLLYAADHLIRPVCDSYFRFARYSLLIRLHRPPGIEGVTLFVLISAQRKYRPRSGYKIQRQNLKYGGNEAMTKQRIGVLVVCLLLAAVGMGQTPPAKQMAVEKSGGVSSAPVMPGSEQWMDIPAAALVGTPSVEMGGTIKIAVLQGDPMTAGRSYTLRLSCTDGTKIAPHWHPTTENVTVIKGTFLLGMGAKWDDAAMKEIPVGGFASAPPQMRHYAKCKGDGVVQVNGIAPFVVNFIGPEDLGPAKKMD